MLFYPGSRLSNLVHLPLYQTASCQFPGGILPSPDQPQKNQGAIIHQNLFGPQISKQVLMDVPSSVG